MSALFVICESWINLYAGRANRGRLFLGLYADDGAGGAFRPAAGRGGRAAIALSVPRRRRHHSRRRLSPSSPPAAGRRCSRNLVPSAGAMPSAADERYGLGAWRLAPCHRGGLPGRHHQSEHLVLMTPIYGAGWGCLPATTVGPWSRPCDRRHAGANAGRLAFRPLRPAADPARSRAVCRSRSAGHRRARQPLCAAAVCPVLPYGATALDRLSGGDRLRQCRSSTAPHGAASASVAAALFGRQHSDAWPGRRADGAHRAAAMLAVLGTGAVLVAAAACYNLRRPAVEAPATAAAEPLSEAKQ